MTVGERSSERIFVIGAGHNGLVCAAYLARAGRKVTVLEEADGVGGVARAFPFAPGYVAPGLFHDTSLFETRIAADLDLAPLGFRRRRRPRLWAPDGAAGLVELEADALARRLPGEARNLGAFRSFVDRLRPVLGPLLSEPPPEVLDPTTGDLLGLAKLAWRARRQGVETLRELLRVLPMAARDLLDEWFRNDAVKAALCLPSMVGTWTGPWSPGTAATLLFHEARRGDEVHGGPSALIAALEAQCRRLGVDVRCSTPALEIRIADGAVQAIRTPDGLENAAAVVTTCDPKKTFHTLISPEHVPYELLEAFDRWRQRGTTAKVHLALRGPLDVAGGTSRGVERLALASSLQEIERAFDGVKYGEIPKEPVLDVWVPSESNPGLAPSGHHVVSILVPFVPHDLVGGSTDGAREELMRRVIARLQRWIPGISERLVSREASLPKDLAARHSLTGGHEHHGEHALDQLLMMRPHPSCARSATPLSGLYLGGSGSHPGGGLTGTPGRLAAAALLKGR